MAPGDFPGATLIASKIPAIGAVETAAPAPSMSLAPVETLGPELPGDGTDGTLPAPSPSEGEVGAAPTTATRSAASLANKSTSADLVARPTTRTQVVVTVTRTRTSNTSAAGAQCTAYVCPTDCDDFEVGCKNCFDNFFRKSTQMKPSIPFPSSACKPHFWQRPQLHPLRRAEDGSGGKSFKVETRHTIAVPFLNALPRNAATAKSFLLIWLVSSFSVDSFCFGTDSDPRSPHFPAFWQNTCGLDLDPDRIRPYPETPPPPGAISTINTSTAMATATTKSTLKVTSSKTTTTSKAGSLVKVTPSTSTTLVGWTEIPNGATGYVTESDSLSPGAIAGVVIGIFAAVGTLFFLLYWFLLRKYLDPPSKVAPDGANKQMIKKNNNGNAKGGPQFSSVAVIPPPPASVEPTESGYSDDSCSEYSESESSYSSSSATSPDYVPQQIRRPPNAAQPQQMATRGMPRSATAMAAPGYYSVAAAATRPPQGHQRQRSADPWSRTPTVQQRTALAAANRNSLNAAQMEVARRIEMEAIRNRQMSQQLELQRLSQDAKAIDLVEKERQLAFAAQRIVDKTPLTYASEPAGTTYGANSLVSVSMEQRGGPSRPNTWFGFPGQQQQQQSSQASLLPTTYPHPPASIISSYGVPQPPESILSGYAPREEPAPSIYSAYQVPAPAPSDILSQYNNTHMDQPQGSSVYTYPHRIGTPSVASEYLQSRLFPSQMIGPLSPGIVDLYTPEQPDIGFAVHAMQSLQGGSETGYSEYLAMRTQGSESPAYTVQRFPTPSMASEVWPGTRSNYIG